MTPHHGNGSGQAIEVIPNENFSERSVLKESLF